MNIEYRNCIELVPVKSGDQGNIVRLLQILLNAGGFDPGKIDGICGMKTIFAINKANQEAGIISKSAASIETWYYLLNK